MFARFCPQKKTCARQWKRGKHTPFQFDPPSVSRTKHGTFRDEIPRTEPPHQTAKSSPRPIFFTFQPTKNCLFQSNFGIFRTTTAHAPHFLKNFFRAPTVFKKVGTAFAYTGARTKQGQRKRRARNKKRLKL